MRAYVRDWVDARRSLSNWVMPMALVLIVVMFLTYAVPSIATIINAVAMVILVIFAIEGVILARRCNNAVRAKFPGTTEAGFSLGFMRILAPASRASGASRAPRGARR